MSSRLSPPFPRGTTWGATTTTDGRQIEGTEWEFPDINFAAASQNGVQTGSHRSYTTVKCRAVRNVSTIALAPKRLAQMASGTFTRIAGYCSWLNQKAYPIDEYLPSGGIPVNDIGWVVIEGPAVVSTAIEADLGVGLTQNTTNADATWLVANTAAASTSSTAGRAIPVLASAASTNLGTALIHRIGYSLTAATSQYTGSDALIMVRRF